MLSTKSQKKIPDLKKMKFTDVQEAQTKKLTEPEKEIPSLHNNKNSKCAEQRKLRAVRRKDRVKFESK